MLSFPTKKRSVVSLQIEVLLPRDQIDVIPNLDVDVN